MEKMNEIFYQERPKFLIKSENIIALEELMNASWRQDFFKELNWPLEVQGAGRIINENNFEIRYPKGDKFFSFAAIIHELGHLRQDEFIEMSDENNSNINKEKDAYARGFERALKYCPEFIEKLENDFQKYKKQSKIADFNSFKDLYDFFSGTVNINLALEKLGDDCSVSEEINALKEAGIDKFFERINQNKVSETINEEEAQNFIIKASELIARE